MAAHMAEQGDGTGHAERVVAQAALEEEPPAYGSWATPVLQHRPQQQQDPQGAAAFPAICLLYTSPSPRDRQKSRMPSSA